MTEWEKYKAETSGIKGQIDDLYKRYYALTANCKCEETVPKRNLSYSGKNLRIFTYFDECVVCLRIHNVVTKKPKKN